MINSNNTNTHQHRPRHHSELPRRRASNGVKGTCAAKTRNEVPGPKEDGDREGEIEGGIGTEEDVRALPESRELFERSDKCSCRAAAEL